MFEARKKQTEAQNNGDGFQIEFSSKTQSLLPTNFFFLVNHIKLKEALTL